MNKKIWSVLLVLASFGAATQANAAITTWQATGTIDAFVDLGNVFNGAIQTGDQFTFTFAIDDLAPSSAAFGIRTYARPGDASVGANGQSVPFSSNPAGDSVRVTNSLVDGFGVTAADTLMGYAVLANLSLVGPASIFTSTALPTSALDMNDFFARNFSLLVGSAQFPSLAGFTGTVSSVAPVPLPAAAWLLISGLGALGVLARRRRAP